ncbi:hypothetical protein IAT38_006907 [Cryptococcus sp. DSM 104549]
MSPPTTPTLTTLAPLHSDILRLIFDFFVASIPLHSRQLQDLLILCRDTYNANVARLYEDVVLDKHNSMGFFFGADGTGKKTVERDISTVDSPKTPWSEYTSYSVRKCALIHCTKRLTLKHTNALKALGAADDAYCMDAAFPTHWIADDMLDFYLLPRVTVLVLHRDLMSSMCEGRAKKWAAWIENIGETVFRRPHVCITFPDKALPWELDVAFGVFTERCGGFRGLTLHNSQAVPDLQLTCRDARVHVFLRKVWDDDENDSIGGMVGAIEKHVRWLFQNYTEADIADLPASLTYYNIHVDPDAVMENLDDVFGDKEAWEDW